MNEKYPEYQNTYYEKYMQARKDAGLKETTEQADANFIKFLVEDEPIPGIDVESTL